MIRVIFFDLGKVLVDFDWHSAAQRIARKSDLQIIEILYRCTSSDIAIAFECGQLNPEEFLRKLRPSLKFQGTTEDLRTLWTEIFTPIQENIELVDRLKKQYVLGMISNTNPLHFNFIQNSYDFPKLFDRLILSYEVGEMKPDRKIFEKAVNGLDVRPDEIIFIDDIQKNHSGAIDLGWHTIHYTSHNDLIKSLHSFSVNT